MKMTRLIRRFQQRVQSAEYVGVDVFNDGRVRACRELNPRQAFDHAFAVDEFSNGLLHREVSAVLEEKKLRRILVIPADQRAASGQA